MLKKSHLKGVGIDWLARGATVKLLLQKTTNQVRLNDELGPLYESNIGTPQGDSISPILFIIYLEAVMHDMRQKLIDQNIISTSIIYADDIDYIMEEELNIHKILQIADETFKNWNMTMNQNKTEIIKITKKDDNWKNCKKLGSLLDIDKDIKNRKKLAESMYNRTWKLWSKKFGLSNENKVKFYNCLIKPILLYNCSTWGLTQGQIDGIESFNRRLLRRTIGIYFPMKIKAEKLYRKTNTTPLYGSIMQQKWNLIRKVLNMDSKVPALYWMQEYFSCKLPKYKGRSNNTLAISIKKDLERISIQLNSKKDFKKLQDIAKDFKNNTWDEMVENMKGNYYQNTKKFKPFIQIMKESKENFPKGRCKITI